MSNSALTKQCWEIMLWDTSFLTASQTLEKNISTTKTPVWASFPKMKNQAADDGCLNELEENNLKKSCYVQPHF
jgi:hypothetical protein